MPTGLDLDSQCEIDGNFGLAMLREVLKLKEKKPWLSEAEFQGRFQWLEKKLDNLIAEGQRFSDPDNVRLAKQLRKQREHLHLSGDGRSRGDEQPRGEGATTGGDRTEDGWL